MFTVKQLFLILSVLSLASAKKNTSIRGSPAEEIQRRGLKKGKKGGSGGYSGGFTPPRGGSPGMPIGTPVGLIEPPAKPCVPYDEARVWITPDYPGDPECQTEGGVPVGSGCCRVFSFNDNGQSTKWLLYDAINAYRDLVVSHKRRSLQLRGC